MKFRVALAQVQSHQADPRTGYLMHDDIYQLAEPIPTGAMSQQLEQIAKKNKCYLVAGLPESSLPGLLYNSAVMFGPDGYLGRSRKILLPNHSVFNERRYFRSAPNINIIDTPLGKFGLQICYDIFSPEITRAHALLGAHTSICISASPGVRRQYFESFIPARAMENTVNFIYVNQSGIQDDLIFWGGSEARSATGKQLLKLRYDEPDFGITTISPITSKNAKNFVPTLRDVPPWIYRELEESSRDV